jgi:hypothetical protein
MLRRTQSSDCIDTQAWPVSSQRMMMIGMGMPIAQSSIERMNRPLKYLGITLG